MKKVEVLNIPAKGESYVMEIEQSLESYQSLVGGYIEVISLGDKFMIVDEEGLIKNLGHNKKASIMTGQTIVGNVFTIKKEDFE